MHAQNKFIEPTKEDLKFLNEFLGRSEDGMNNIFAVHGFLTAIITTPIEVPPNEWLLMILNLDPRKPVFMQQRPLFSSEEESSKVILAIHNLKEYITATLQSEKPYYPLVSIEDPKMAMFKAKKENVSDWCNGYLHGVDCYLKAWSIVQNVFVPLVPFAVVSGSYSYEDLVKDMDPKSLNKNEDLKYCMETIPTTVKSLYRYWQANPYKEVAKANAAEKLIKSFKQWNEKCTCGSGKRFGDCCLKK